MIVRDDGPGGSHLVLQHEGRQYRCGVSTHRPGQVDVEVYTNESAPDQLQQDWTLDGDLTGTWTGTALTLPEHVPSAVSVRIVRWLASMYEARWLSILPPEIAPAARRRAA